MENLLCAEAYDICVYNPAFKSVEYSVPKTLSDCIKNINYANLTNNILSKTKNEDANESLLNYKTLEITQLLADAIDKNAVLKVKILKDKYGHLDEFAVAKQILNNKCKELWNAYETKNKKLKIPKDAMKALGITNQQSLDVLLGDTIRYFEKDEENTTSFVISSILKNENLDYTLADIHRYLKQMMKKENCFLNYNTVTYLIKFHDYTKLKLLDLGVDDITIKRALKNIGAKDTLKYYYSNIRQKI